MTFNERQVGPQDVPIEQVREVRAGEVISQELLNRPAKAINRLIGHINRPGQLIRKTTATPGQSFPPTMFRVIANHADHITAQRFDGEEPSGDVVNIAKRWDLRRTPFDEKTVDGKSYVYTNDNERVATRGEITETQLITPDYFDGAVIWATNNPHGGTGVILDVGGDGVFVPLTWLADVDSRDFAHDAGQTE